MKIASQLSIASDENVERGRERKRERERERKGREGEKEKGEAMAAQHAVGDF